MDYLTVVVLVVPALIGLGAAVALGPNRGSILGAGVMLVAVFVLLLFQVTPPPPSRGSARPGVSCFSNGTDGYHPSWLAPRSDP